MKFVALLSGGKDSVYATMVAERYGHELVCGAHLHPADEAEVEVDSFCFQSAAHGAVAGVAACLGVPLIRAPILGGATRQELVYAGAAAGDEVEDLFALLVSVVAAHPEVEAVSSGAILSTYQRTRVEDVCARLGLRSLSYLWRAPQRRLLRRMARDGLDAIVVKTATLGLEPSAHLGLRLRKRSTRALLRTLNEKYGVHEAGEGGEYESLVLDCPRFSRRLVLAETETVRLDDMPRGCGAVGVLSVNAWRLGDRDADSADSADSDDDAVSDDSSDAESDATAEEAAAEDEYVPEAALDWGVAAGGAPGGDARLASVASPASVGDATRGIVAVDGLRGAAALGAGAQMTAVLEAASRQLAAAGLSLRDVFFAHLYLADVGDFRAVNAAYVAFFEAAFAAEGGAAAAGARPPSRSCVAAPLPAGALVLLDLDACPAGRDALYVRSISSWAPVCIGPYCQANTLRRCVVFAAGQIPLDAPTMTVDPDRPFFSSLNLSLRHATRVLAACEDAAPNACLVVYVAGPHIRAAGEHLAGRAPKTPTLVVRVPALPAAAPVEVEAIGIAARDATRLEYAESVDGTVRTSSALLRRSFCAAVAAVRPRPAAAAGGAAAVAALVAACEAALQNAGLKRDHWLRLRVFCLAADAPAVEAELRRAPPGPALTVVPVAGLPPGTALAAQALGADLAKLDTERWLREGVA